MFAGIQFTILNRNIYRTEVQPPVPPNVTFGELYRPFEEPIIVESDRIKETQRKNEKGFSENAGCELDPGQSAGINR